MKVYYQVRIVYYAYKVLLRDFVLVVLIVRSFDFVKKIFFIFNNRVLSSVVHFEIKYFRDVVDVLFFVDFHRGRRRDLLL